MEENRGRRLEVATKHAQELLEESSRLMKELHTMAPKHEDDEYFRDIYLRGAAVCSLLHSLVNSFKNDKEMYNPNSPAFGIASEITNIIIDLNAVWAVKCLKYVGKTKPVQDGHA